MLLPPLEPGIRPLKNDDLVRLFERYPSLPHKPGGKTCITCRGKGSFLWRSGTGMGVMEYECSCADQWLLHCALLNANVQLMYQRLTWADMTATETGAINKVREYLDNADGYVNSGIGLMLYGEMGTGKTALSTLLIKRLLGDGQDCYFTTFSEMIDTYTGGWNDKEQKAWFHKRIKNAGVLVMDDVGKEYQGRAKHGLPESTFDEVLRHRVAASTPTILTTNHDMKALQEGYGGNVMSLLHERSTTYRFTGDDYRDSSRMRGIDEAQAGLVRPITLGGAV